MHPLPLISATIGNLGVQIYFRKTRQTTFTQVGKPMPSTITRLLYISSCILFTTYNDLHNGKLQYNTFNSDANITYLLSTLQSITV